jgi:hypothetical protein
MYVLRERERARQSLHGRPERERDREQGSLCMDVLRERETERKAVFT